MSAYTIYEKPGLPLDETINCAVLVKEHFSLFAFLVPPLWMLVRRQWWPLLAYLLLLVPISMLNGILPEWSNFLMAMLISLWFGLEASSLIGWTLRRKGYIEAGSLYAENQDHCEHRYAQARLAQQRQNRGQRQETRKMREQMPRRDIMTREPSDHGDQTSSIIGLFPDPEPSQESK